MAVFATSVFVAIVAAILARELKISEFRQKWIDDLRIDIADYISTVELFIHEYEGHYEGESDERSSTEKAKAKDAHLNKAKTILNRVRLRFKPDPDRDDADTLASLGALLDPMKWPPKNEISSAHPEWTRCADQAIAASRRLLKREWEVTKKPWKRWFGRTRQSPNALNAS